MWLFLFIISAVINTIFMLYIRWLLNNFRAITEDVDSVKILIRDFSKHLKSVHELEMFYGDETLTLLIAHSKELSQRLDDIDFLFEEEETEDIKPLEAELTDDNKT